MKQQPAALMVAAPWRSSGKTSFTMGLARLLHNRGIAVQCYKKGPDYIDPMWLASASGKACYSLDSWIQSGDEIRQSFARGADGVRLLEGVMGLHDGLCDEGRDSSAAIAKLLALPVVLVINCKGMHRTVASLINGLTCFDDQVRYAGVVLNRVGGSRHEAKLRRAIEQHTDIAVIGSLGECSAMRIDERELGLLPTLQAGGETCPVTLAAQMIEQNCDVSRLLQQCATPSVDVPALPISNSHKFKNLRMGVAWDEAFSFYYADDLEYLIACGAKLHYFSPMRDQLPANLDGLLLGGGFPERYAAQLAANRNLHRQLHGAIAGGLAVHAECGGLMYLCNSMVVDGQVHSMVGSIDATVHLHEKPVGRGYARLLRKEGSAAEVPAHEFHHASLQLLSPQRFTYKVLRGMGISEQQDGIRVHNVIASFAHLRHTLATPWIDEFLHRISPQPQVQADYVQTV